VAVTFQQMRAGEVPLLAASAEDARGALPLVLWFHGFGVDKEVHRPELERVAAAGFLAVGVDAAGHGERRLPDLDARQAAPREQALRTMIELAERTAYEVPRIIRALVEEGRADAGRVAIAGVSMGGYVVYRTVVVEPLVRAAVAILGSPEWPHGDSPHRHLDALGRTALLSITGERDENVPPAAARALHRRLGEAEPGARHRYVEIPGAEHLVSAEQWETVMDETIRWLTLHNR
jgi:pimeloyl-ACP methyl ester carboxylesterase